MRKLLSLALALGLLLGALDTAGAQQRRLDPLNCLQSDPYAFLCDHYRGPDYYISANSVGGGYFDHDDGSAATISFLGVRRSTALTAYGEVTHSEGPSAPPVGALVGLTPHLTGAQDPRAYFAAELPGGPPLLSHTVCHPVWRPEGHWAIGYPC